MVKTYKKVIFFVNASFGAGFTSDQIAVGVDNYTIGQSSATDGQVPTGSRLKYFEVQFAANNPLAVPIFVNCTLQYLLTTQSAIDPRLVGGNAQRNQVLHMDNFSVGFDQNSNHKFKFKIPPKFQRIKEGMRWFLTWSTTGTVNREVQIIYTVEQ